jgi:hypothetical protein
MNPNPLDTWVVIEQEKDADVVAGPFRIRDTEIKLRTAPGERHRRIVAVADGILAKAPDWVRELLPYRQG